MVPGIDGTTERRRGERTAAEGVRRDPARSSRGRLAEAGGLRRLSLTLPAPVPRAGRARALPFLTAPAPSERRGRERGRRHERPTDRARRVALQARRWLPGRGVVPPGDGGSAAPDLPASLARHGPVCIARPRLDAALCGPAPPRKPGTVGRPRTEGARLPNLPDVLADEAPSRVEVAVPGRHGGGDRTAEACPGTAVRCHAGLPVVPIRRVLPRDPRGRLDPRALPRAEPESDPLQVARRFVRRWRVEVTFREARDHLGVETRRQWSGRAVARATPRLPGLLPPVAPLAARLDRRARAAAWCRKPRPTFADTLAAVRRRSWRGRGSLPSWRRSEARKLGPALRHGIASAPCRAARTARAEISTESG